MIKASVPGRRIGQDGPQVAGVGLGCMGMSWAYSGDGDERRSIATIQHMIDACGEHPPLIDTADVYGPFTNEELVGRALVGRRDEVVLATKVGIVATEPGDGSYDSQQLRRDARPERIAGACEDSLRRLRTDVLDLYQLHRVDPQVPLEDSWGAMARLVERGLVRRIGLSQVTTEQLERAHAIHPVATVQNELSLWQRAALEGGVVRWADEHGATVLPFAPLGRGVLTGAVDPTSLPGGDFRRSAGYLQGDAWQANRRAVEVVAEQAQRLGATPAQIALAWVISRGERVVPIPGTTRPQRIDENLAAASLALDETARAALDAVAPALGENPSA